MTYQDPVAEEGLSRGKHHLGDVLFDTGTGALAGGAAGGGALGTLGGVAHYPAKGVHSRASSLALQDAWATQMRVHLLDSKTKLDDMASVRTQLGAPNALGNLGQTSADPVLKSIRKEMALAHAAIPNFRSPIRTWGAKGGRWGSVLGAAALGLPSAWTALTQGEPGE